MKTLRIDKIVRVIKNHQRLMKELDVKISNSGKDVTIQGTAENEHVAGQVLEALNYGIPFTEAIAIKKENKILETINIKDHTNKNNLEQVRGRVIGQGGKALQTISTLTDSSIELKENTVAIVSTPENMKRATEALIAIIKGAKHGAVYKELEHNFPEPIYDLGLKDKPTKTMQDYEDALKKLEKKE